MALPTMTLGKHPMQDDLEILFAAIQEQLQSGDLAELEVSCRRFLSLQPDHEFVLHVLSALLLDTDRPDLSEDFIRRRLKIVPIDAAAHRDLGRALSAQQKLTEAEEALSNSLKLDQTLAGTRLALALIYDAQGRSADAELMLDGELTMDPTNAFASLKLAFTLAKNRKSFLSSLSLGRFIHLQPEHADAHKWLGRLHRETGSYDDAMDSFETAVNLQPGLIEEITRENIVVGAPDAKSATDQTLYAFYDLEINPLTFNILHFLILADIDRRRRNLENIHVVFVPGKEEGFGGKMDNDAYLQKDGQDWRLKNLVIPAVYLVPTCKGHTTCVSRSQATGMQRDSCTHVFPRGYRCDIPMRGYESAKFSSLAAVVQSYRNDGKISYLRATKQASRYVEDWIAARSNGRPVVSISLRTQAYLSKRNSDLDAWGSFAQWLDGQGFMPLIVRDTETLALPVPQQLQGFPEMPEASMNLDIRAAVNEASYIALATSAGPNALLYHNEYTRYAILRVINEGDAASSPEFFERATGFPVGGQFPWCKPWQRYDYVDDTFENIQTSFQQIIELIANNEPQRAPTQQELQQ